MTNLEQLIHDQEKALENLRSMQASQVPPAQVVPAPPAPVPPVVPPTMIDGAKKMLMNAVGLGGMSALAPIINECKLAAQKALTVREYAEMVAHFDEGALGLSPFLRSDALQELIKVSHETYTEFLAGRLK